MFENKDIVVNTWLPESIVKDAVKETEDKAVGMIMKLIEKEEANGTENAGGDRVETDSGSEEE